MERRPLWQRTPPALPEETMDDVASGLSRSKTYSGSSKAAHRLSGGSDEGGIRRHQSMTIRRPLAVTTGAPSSPSASSSHPTSPTSPTDATWTPTPEEVAVLKGSHRREETAGLDDGFQELHINEQPNRPAPKLFPLVTSFETQIPRGATSAAAYVKPIGHSSQNNPDDQARRQPVQFHERGVATAAPGTQAERWLAQKAAITGDTREATSPPALPSSSFNSFAPFENSSTDLALPFGRPPPLPAMDPTQLAQLWQPPLPKSNPMLASQASVMALAAQKGYNPTQFDCKPRNAHFCVIKSYTEDDVHKSIKYEIWSSTVLGNKRLDRVYREGAPQGPVYLFFSVNGSGHFCGVAEMLSPVDETVDSKVWSDNKWKGIFKVRWIYVKDVPNSALRHLRLSNTAENKPVTSSRDTQEVPHDIGCQILNIFKGYPSKTTLLEDLSYYDAQEQAKQLGESLLARHPQQLPPSQRPAYMTPSQVVA